MAQNNLMKYIQNSSLIILESGAKGFAICKGDYWVFVSDTSSNLYLQTEGHPTTLAIEGSSFCDPIKEIWSPAKSLTHTLLPDTTYRKLVWKKEKERVNMTIEEIEEKLGYKINIISNKGEN